VKPIEIVDGDDERLYVPMTVKVKGRKPLCFTVPRYDAIDPDEYAAMIAAVEAVDNDDTIKPYEKVRASRLAMLRRFVNDVQYAALEQLKTVQLEDISRHWAQQSQVSLPELLASSPTSTVTTVRPSDTTSSPSSESDAATLAAV